MSHVRPLWTGWDLKVFFLHFFEAIYEMAWVCVLPVGDQQEGSQEDCPVILRLPHPLTGMTPATPSRPLLPLQLIDTRTGQLVCFMLRLSDPYLLELQLANNADCSSWFIENTVQSGTISDEHDAPSSSPDSTVAFVFCRWSLVRFLSNGSPFFDASHPGTSKKTGYNISVSNNRKPTQLT